YPKYIDTLHHFTIHLAIKLAQKGFTITFINTESTHYQITQKNSNIDIFYSVQGHQDLDIRYMTVSDGQPVNFNRSLNHDQFMASLLHVFSTHVEEALVKTIESKLDPLVTCLIADSFFVFPGKLAKKYGLLYISFWTEPALVFTLYYHLHLLKLHDQFKDMHEDPIDYIPGVRSIKPKDLMSYLQETDTTSMCHQIIFNAFNDVRNADFILCNTELEYETISALQIEKPYYAIGPIFPPEFTKSGVTTSMWFESDCTHQLDLKQHATVLYMSFGRFSFIWVLRPDIVSSDDPNRLPKDFEGEICGLFSKMSVDSLNNRRILDSLWLKLNPGSHLIGLNLCDKNPITKVEISEKIHNFMYGKLSDECRNAIKEVKKTLENNSLRAEGSFERNLDNFIGRV
ncbi:hypothetical protein H5410_039987, partial [Solanum commersonii]